MTATQSDLLAVHSVIKQTSLYTEIHLERIFLEIQESKPRWLLGHMAPDLSGKEASSPLEILRLAMRIHLLLKLLHSRSFGAFFSNCGYKTEIRELQFMVQAGSLPLNLNHVLHKSSSTRKVLVLPIRRNVIISTTLTSRSFNKDTLLTNSLNG